MAKFGKFLNVICLSATLAAVCISPVASFAQTAMPAAPAMPSAPKAAAPAMTPAPAMPSTGAAKAAAKPRSEKSMECSKQADAKSLHGKDRKTFRNECMKGA